MNRLVLIGNGFDLAHGLKTSYADFINWYWGYWGYRLLHSLKREESDALCTFSLNDGEDLYHFAHVWSYRYKRDNPFEPLDVYAVVNEVKKNKDFFNFTMCPFLERICKSIETKKWVDIEKEYYILLKDYIFNNNDIDIIIKLNAQLQCLKDRLVEYLNTIDINEKIMKSEIRPKIYSPFKLTDFPGEGQNALKEHVKSGLNLDKKDIDAKLSQYGSSCYSSGSVEDYRKKLGKVAVYDDETPIELLLPNQIMVVNFNYTHTPHLYIKKGTIFPVIQIHGDLNNPNSIIFGYGDEMDSDYKKIVNKDDNRLLSNIKQIKYHESDNYHKVYSFIESEPYQLVIMGHSCGISDRTLLNTLLEHKNCVSIKPYYHKKADGSDNYIELVQNITRNFNEDRLMRNKMVDKPYCEPLTK